MAAQVSAHNRTLGSISLGYISFGTLALLASQKTIKPPLFGSKYPYNSPLLASNLVSSLEKDPHSDGCKSDMAANIKILQCRLSDSIYHGSDWLKFEFLT